MKGLVGGSFLHMLKSGSVMTSKGSGPCCCIDDTFVMLTKVMLLIICPSAFSAKISSWKTARNDRAMQSTLPLD